RCRRDGNLVLAPVRHRTDGSATGRKHATAEHSIFAGLSGTIRWRGPLCCGSVHRGRRARGEAGCAAAHRREPLHGQPTMSNTTIGLIGLGFLFLLFILRMPVGLSMLITGFLGTVAIRGWTHALPSLSSETFAIASFYQLCIIPMFVLMGNVAGASGMGR